MILQFPLYRWENWSPARIKGNSQSELKQVSKLSLQTLDLEPTIGGWQTGYFKYRGHHPPTGEVTDLELEARSFSKVFSCMILPWVFQKKHDRLSDTLYLYNLISGIRENSTALSYLLNTTDYCLPGAKFPNYWRPIDERNYVNYHSTLCVLDFLLIWYT